MREIKFRAWDIIQKQMCYDVSIYSEIETESWWSADVRGESGDKIYSFEYGELMQFTGLTDKNGTTQRTCEMLSIKEILKRSTHG